jgi:hypothetical protein
MSPASLSSCSTIYSLLYDLYPLFFLRTADPAAYPHFCILAILFCLLFCIVVRTPQSTHREGLCPQLESRENKIPSKICLDRCPGEPAFSSPTSHFPLPWSLSDVGPSKVRPAHVLIFSRRLSLACDLFLALRCRLSAPATVDFDDPKRAEVDWISGLTVPSSKASRTIF